MQGTLINAATVIVGSSIGLLIHSKLPKRIITIAFQGIGLFTIFLGINMASKASEILLMIFHEVTKFFKEKFDIQIKVLDDAAYA